LLCLFHFPGDMTKSSQAELPKSSIINCTVIPISHCCVFNLSVAPCFRLPMN
jgi:hypothetical protein